MKNSIGLLFSIPLEKISSCEGELCGITPWLDLFTPPSSPEKAYGVLWFDTEKELTEKMIELVETSDFGFTPLRIVDISGEQIVWSKV